MSQRASSTNPNARPDEQLHPNAESTIGNGHSEYGMLELHIECSVINLYLRIERLWHVWVVVVTLDHVVPGGQQKVRCGVVHGGLDEKRQELKWMVVDDGIQGKINLLKICF